MTSPQSPKTALAKLLAICSLPMYAVDERRRIVYCNPACAGWLGIEPATLIGQRCDYHSAGPPGAAEDLAAGLCPPPEVFHGQRASGEVSCRDLAGQLQRRRAEFLPLPGQRDNGFAAVAFVDAANLPEMTLAHGPASDSTTFHQRLRAFLHELGPRVRLNQIVGDSPAMVRVREQLHLALAGSPRVLLVGPPGSGRETIARWLHYGAGKATASPLAPLACQLLDGELLETTVSSFLASCADQELVQPATLLLLEADQLPPDAQAALAGVLSNRELPLRTLATARVPLLELATNDRFHPDLAYALSTLVIEIPPLAERPQDIPLLAQLFLEQVNATGANQLAGFSQEALDQLLAYPWPGNVDELAALIQQACATATGPQVVASALPERIRLTAAAAAHPPREDDRIVLDDFLAEIEQELLQRALKQSKGNKAEAARLLGISRPRLFRRLEFFGIT
ncbi:MAG: sigma 54-interacting transcriptional regulator [Planctomycetota bacterium]|nr:sigma 54-interacting transcriptional regulator [Planctomycetota bacterium]